jgi:hypothetical protein
MPSPPVALLTGRSWVVMPLRALVCSLAFALLSIAVVGTLFEFFVGGCFPVDYHTSVIYCAPTGRNDRAVILSRTASGVELPTRFHLWLYDPARTQSPLRLPWSRSKPSCVACLPNTNQFVVGGWDGSIHLADLTDPDRSPSLLGRHSDGTISLQCSADGRYLVSRSNASLRAWDLVSQKTALASKCSRTDLPRHRSAVNTRGCWTARWLPTRMGSQVRCASADRTSPTRLPPVRSQVSCGRPTPGIRSQVAWPCARRGASVPLASGCQRTDSRRFSLALRLGSTIRFLPRFRLFGDDIRGFRLLVGGLGFSLAPTSGNIAGPSTVRLGSGFLVRSPAPLLERRRNVMHLGHARATTTRRCHASSRLKMLADSKTAPSVLAATKSQATFYGLWLFVMLVSVFDGFLSLRYRHSLPNLELNPIGQTLLAANDGRVWYLLLAKFVGTVLACAILLLIHHIRPHLGLLICLILAALQFCLLLFLLWGDPSRSFTSIF